MPKQPHVIVNIGRTGNVMSKGDPQNYSLEAYGYTADEVAELIATVHGLVRPAEDDEAEELPVPFKLPGFTLVSKLSEVNAAAWQELRDWKSDPDDPNGAAHSVADGLDRCDCGTDTPSPGRIAVRLNGVNHRFPSYGHARDFTELYGLDHTAVFIRNATDPSLCCFPYVFQLPTGEHMAFETRGMAEELARVNGIDLAEITYHKDEHRPEHRVDEEQWRARTKREQTAAASRLCTDRLCEQHTTADERNAYREEQAATAVEQQRESDRIDAIGYAVGGLVSGMIPGQRDDEPAEQDGPAGSDDLGYDDGPRQRMVAAEQAAAELARRDAAAAVAAEHPNPCLPGCGCGNGPAPLAADEPTDG